MTAQILQFPTPKPPAPVCKVNMSGVYNVECTIIGDQPHFYMDYTEEDFFTDEESDLLKEEIDFLRGDKND